MRRIVDPQPTGLRVVLTPYANRWAWKVMDPGAFLLNGSPFARPVASGTAGTRARAERRATRVARREWALREQERLAKTEGHPLEWEVWTA